ncbi:acyl-CoA N-acyltransferase [Daldinia decipiens]|uniref:acyl-CoA N-acyltransferase n=1 Tax=Daldinia decipiens TaxID=326647 RepID=UPI0020C349BF|nr:acyl-CoA N-acyltransferase [Daldinia decipiens]KAI1660208.1 acyl-CoA N-acyltransferase [Daldinia decipiens]
MPLELQPATEADAPRAAEIESAAYGPNPFNKILFPGPFPPEAVAGRGAQLAAELKRDPTARWLKVVDTDLPEGEQMIAFAKWHIYTEKPPQPAPRSFGPGCNAEACELVFGDIAKLRSRIWGDKRCVYLSLLHTDPKHQGRGAGSTLTKWGIEEAKRLGLVVYLESSSAAHSLYEKHGFRDIEVLTADLSKWGATEEHKTWSMKYDPSGIAS